MAGRSNDPDDYKKTYASFWKEIVENPDGTLNLDQVMRELHDFHTMLESVPKVYCAVTNDRISKPNTDPDAVIAEYEDCVNELIREKKEEFLEFMESSVKEVNGEKVVDLETIKQMTESVF